MAAAQRAGKLDKSYVVVGSDLLASIRGQEPERIAGSEASV
jgi:hypothetical protein